MTTKFHIGQEVFLVEDRGYYRCTVISAMHDADTDSFYYHLSGHNFDAEKVPESMILATEKEAQAGPGPIKLPGLIQFRKCTLPDKELAKRTADALMKMYETGSLPSRTIPARPDEDFDLLVGELIVRFIEATGNDFE